MIPTFLQILLLLLQSTATVWYLSADSSSGALSLGVVLVLLASIALLFFFQLALIVLNLFFFRVLNHLFSSFKISETVKKYLSTIYLSIISLILPLYLIIDDIHFKFMGARLDYNYTLLLLDGASSDMSPIRLQHFLVGVSAFGLWFLIILFSSTSNFSLSYRNYAIIKCFLIPVLFFTLIIDTAFGAIDQEGLELRSKFVWNSSMTFPDPKTNIAHQGFLGDIPFTDEDITKAAKKRIKESDLALASITSKKTELPLHKPNILFLVVESLRSDVFTEEYMPHLYERKDEWMVLENHFSSGANSGSGDFGLITGLNSFYFRDHKALNISPFPFKVLKALGYELSIYFSNSMKYENIYDIFFEPLFDKTVHPEEKSQPEWDIELVNNYLREIPGKNSNAPWFDFLRIYVTHYGFYYPPDFETYVPTVSSDLKLSCGTLSQFKKHKEGLKNRFLNSVRFADHLLNKILTTLESQGRFEDTIIVILGDHGEEFWEKGKFGHVFGLTKEQIQTTALIRFPESYRKAIKNYTHTQYTSSSHSDIFPTIFEFMGLDQQIVPSGTFNGRSLLEYNPDKDFVVASTGLIRENIPRKHITVQNSNKVFFTTANEKIEIEKVTDLNDFPQKNFSRSETKNLIKKVEKNILGF